MNNYDADDLDLDNGATIKNHYIDYSDDIWNVPKDGSNIQTIDSKETNETITSKETDKIDSPFDRFSRVPEDLKKENQWVCWRRVNRNGKCTKVPYDVKNQKFAAVNDPNTWSSFKEAVENADLYDGIGFVLTENDPFGAIDIDHAFDSNNKPSDLARIIIDHIDCYWEISPSGRGFRGIGEFCLPHGGRKFSKPGVELYSENRYITITGDQLKGSKNTTEDVEEKVLEVLEGLEKKWGSNDSSPASKANVSKDLHIEELSTEQNALLQKAFNQKNGASIKKLWDGDWESIYGSQSEADLALLRYLCFYFKDPLQLEQVFSHSELGKREKWIEREDYRSRQIGKVLSSQTEFYSEPQKNEDINWEDIDSQKSIDIKKIDDRWMHKSIRSLRNQLMKDEDVSPENREYLLVSGVFNDTLRSVIGKRIYDRWETQINYVGSGLNMYICDSGSGKSSTIARAKRIYEAAATTSYTKGSDILSIYGLPSGKTSLKGILIETMKAYKAYEKSTPNKKSQRKTKAEAKKDFQSNTNGMVWFCDEATEPFKHLLGAWSDNGCDDSGRLTELVESGTDTSNASGEGNPLYLFDNCNQYILVTQPDSYAQEINPFSFEKLRQGLTARISGVYSDRKFIDSETIDDDIDNNAINKCKENIKRLLDSLTGSRCIEATFGDKDLVAIIESLPFIKLFMEENPKEWKSWRKNILRRARRNAALWALLDGEPILTVTNEQDYDDDWEFSGLSDDGKSRVGTINASKQIDNAILYESVNMINHYVETYRLNGQPNAKYMHIWRKAFHQSENGYLFKSDMINMVEKNHAKRRSVEDEIDKLVAIGVLEEGSIKSNAKGRPAKIYRISNGE